MYGSIKMNGKYSLALLWELGVYCTVMWKEALDTLYTGMGVCVRPCDSDFTWQLHSLHGNGLWAYASATVSVFFFHPVSTCMLMCVRVHVSALLERSQISLRPTVSTMEMQHTPRVCKRFPAFFFFGDISDSQNGMTHDPIFVQEYIYMLIYAYLHAYLLNHIICRCILLNPLIRW